MYELYHNIRYIQRLENDIEILKNVLKRQENLIATLLQELYILEEGSIWV